MAGPYTPYFYPDNDPGEKVSPELAAEIRFLAPSTVTSGSISTAKLAEKAVTTSKLDDKAVAEEKLGDGAVSTRALGADSVTQDKIHDDAVGPDQVTVGVPTIVDSTNSPINVAFKRVTAAEMATINAGTPDPNVIYLVN